MRIIKALGGILLVGLIVAAGNNRIGQLPPLAEFLDPFHGFWQNEALSNKESSGAGLMLRGLNAPVTVVTGPRGVPHVFAQNDHDLYLVQGYLTAKDRLWQMEFQTYAAAGRLSEILGAKTLKFDLEQRREGMVWAAERSDSLIETDSVSLAVMNAYSDGVNLFISSLTANDLPLEYKLLDYRPEKWTRLKSSLLLKLMAKMLTGSERDRPNTEALKLLGPELFKKLFPEQNRLPDPVAPGFKVDTSTINAKEEQPFLSQADWKMSKLQPEFVGSNNWAVSGRRTENGSAILCNDPHLGLSLPSIWYEIQLNGPGQNCYGVSLPGSPGITIGFNDSIAWGVTNAGRDVKDYYEISFTDSSRRSYRFADSSRTASLRIEQIKVRGGSTIVDTVRYTHYGPVAYHDLRSNRYLALNWAAHRPSNELKTFYGLNRARNLEDYRKALSSYQCPGQNFAYADVKNNIAIWQQGKFLERPKNNGRFILDGADPKSEATAFIPMEDNPHLINPERGFVSSANQPPTDTTYPYYYTGVFEEFRNRTINNFLRNDSSVSISDMMGLQLSNYNLLAAEALPLMLQLLDTSRFQNPDVEELALQELQSWNYYDDKGMIAPTVFEIWWDEMNKMLWDEFNRSDWDQDLYYRYSWEELLKTGKGDVDMRDPHYVYPMPEVTLSMLKGDGNDLMFDHHYTNDKKETAKDVLYDSFYWTALKFGDIIKYKFSRPHWGYYKGTHVRHLLRLDALGSKRLFVGGNRRAPNAITDTHGPSWRMIVQLDPEGIRAWGVLPGGQSGNPGSSLYTTSLSKWTEGEYYELNFLHADELENEDSTNLKITYKPEKP